MSEKPDDSFLNSVGRERISARQIDELIGLARGVALDGLITVAEAEFLQKWLAASAAITQQPLIKALYYRINEILHDGMIDEEERSELLDTLGRFSNRDFELGEVMKATTLPLCHPAPILEFKGRRYCFTGTFMFGQRKLCEEAVRERGAEAGSLTQRTNVLVIGTYATESWKHSSFGTKILRAVEWRERGIPISIVSEQHWIAFVGKMAG